LDLNFLFCALGEKRGGGEKKKTMAKAAWSRRHGKGGRGELKERSWRHPSVGRKKIKEKDEGAEKPTHSMEAPAKAFGCHCMDRERGGREKGPGKKGKGQPLEKRAPLPPGGKRKKNARENKKGKTIPVFVPPRLRALPYR